MHGLGRPIRICTRHIDVLDCPHGCLGVNLDDVGELQSATHSGCAVCRLPQPRSFGSRPFRILRKCHHRRCCGRFHKVPFDDLCLGEWLEFWGQRLRRITHLFQRRENE